MKNLLAMNPNRIERHYLTEYQIGYMNKHGFYPTEEEVIAVLKKLRERKR